MEVSRIDGIMEGSGMGGDSYLFILTWIIIIVGAIVMIKLLLQKDKPQEEELQEEEPQEEELQEEEPQEEELQEEEPQEEELQEEELRKAKLLEKNLKK